MGKINIKIAKIIKKNFFYYYIKKSNIEKKIKTCD